MSFTNTKILVISLALGLIRGAFGADAVNCVPVPSLQVALFDTSTVAPFADSLMAARTSALATQLPQAAQAQNLDVMCLTELRDSDARDTALNAFRNDPSWHIYQPVRLQQPGCQNACSHQTYNAFNTNLPLNQWVQFCTLTTIPGTDKSCANESTDTLFRSCVDRFCPFLRPELLAVNNASCDYCLEDKRSGETVISRTIRCATTYNSTSASQCQYGYAGEAGTTILSRYPFLENDYYQFPQPSSLSQPGLANRGIAYAKIQTALGPVHVFCGSQATAQSGLDSGVAQPLNAAQSQDVLNFINSKANGQTAIFLADTGSGPALSSPSPAANAQWPANFTLLQSGLRDALLTNVDSNSLPHSAASCTYGCDGSTPDKASYVDHVMISGLGVAASGNQTPLCATNGGTFFTSPAAVTFNNMQFPLSEHYGVQTTISLGYSPSIVSSQVSITQSGFGRNRATGIWTATLTLKNTGAKSIAGPVQVGLSNLTTGVLMTNNTGSAFGYPFLTVSSGALAPGASLSLPIQFTNPSNLLINYTPVTYSGGLN